MVYIQPISRTYAIRQLFYTSEPPLPARAPVRAAAAWHRFLVLLTVFRASLSVTLVAHVGVADLLME